MSIHPHDVRELLGPQSTTTPVSDEQVQRMVAVLNTCRAQHASTQATRPEADGTSGAPEADRPGSRSAS